MDLPLGRIISDTLQKNRSRDLPQMRRRLLLSVFLYFFSLLSSHEKNWVFPLFPLTFILLSRLMCCLRPGELDVNVKRKTNKKALVLRKWPNGKRICRAIIEELWTRIQMSSIPDTVNSFGNTKSSTAGVGKFLSIKWTLFQRSQYLHEEQFKWLLQGAEICGTVDSIIHYMNWVTREVGTLIHIINVFLRLWEMTFKGKIFEVSSICT